MKRSRRQFLHLAAGAAAVPAASRIARAQVYPTRPITMILPTAVGGPVDVVGRMIAEGMRGYLGQPVIVENITGADGSIAVGRAARARPDGYTIDFGYMSTHVLNGAFYSLQYDLLNDFVPIAPMERTALIIVGRKTLPASDLRELIAWLKANPNRASLAVVTAGIRLLARYFQEQTGTQFVLVPYRGTGPGMQDLVAGQIDLLVDTLRNSMPLVRAGSIKAYAVTSDTRLAMAPEVPTFAEMGLPVLSYTEWVGLFAPKGTPTDIVRKLNAAVVETLANPALRARLVEFGAEIFPREQQTPEVLGELVKSDAQKWWPIIKELGIKVE
jgi:tripartite-type tricarboxylate transporter receptor subunit TctC